MKNKEITVESIANALGCSKTTVSRAISGRGRVSEDTKKRVLDYCRTYNYKPKWVSEILNESRTYNLVAVLPVEHRIHEIPFFQNCLLGICEQASKMNYNVFVVSIEENDLSQLKRVVENHKADGAILLRAVMHDVAAEYLIDKGISFVQVGGRKDPSVIYVDHDSENACKNMTTYLLEKKKHRIALIGGDMEHIISQKRLAGFYAGFELFQKIPDEKLVYLNCNSDLDVYEAVERIVEQYVESIVCMDDKICGQVLRKLNKMRISIPTDIEIVSFYDSTMLQNYSPAITALKFDEKALGRIACEKLIRKLEKGEEESFLLAGYSMELRESTRNQ